MSREKLKPTQPFFVLEADSFLQEIHLDKGISHFYQLALHKKASLRIVPDACIDFVFVYTSNGMKAYATGGTLECGEQVVEEDAEYFGVRFMPGFAPKGFDVTLADIIGKSLILKDIIKDYNSDFIEEMSEQKDFSSRIKVFLQYYQDYYEKEEEIGFKESTLYIMKKMIYDSFGTIKISVLAEKTGYSERYINRLFIDNLGCSPKTFCKIIQFQRSLGILDECENANMKELALKLGFYDQSQFIKDFKRFCGYTPKQYLEITKSPIYIKKIRNIDYF